MAIRDANFHYGRTDFLKFGSGGSGSSLFSVGKFLSISENQHIGFVVCNFQSSAFPVLGFMAPHLAYSPCVPHASRWREKSIREMWFCKWDSNLEERGRQAERTRSERKRDEWSGGVRVARARALDFEAL